MLNSVNLDDKSYEELLAEAIGQIPLLSSEWTNFNISDPGITVMQNLTAFNHLQQAQMNEFGEALQLRLLNLLGFEAGKNMAAKVLVSLRAKQPVKLARHSSFFVGDLQFELEDAMEVMPCGIRSVVFEESGKARNITYLLENEVEGGVAVFSEKPVAGNKLLLFLENNPFENNDFILWTEVENRGLRNPAPSNNLPKLAQVKWQVFTQNGWQTAETTDETGAFLQSGMIRIAPPLAKPCLHTAHGETSYAIRCVLNKTQYDIPPRLKSIEVNLFEMVQRRTCADMVYANGAKKVFIKSRLAAKGNVFVYCRERGERKYREYCQVTKDIELHGRYFYTDTESKESIGICFDKEKFGFAPENTENAILVVFYDNEAVLHRDIGQVFGYEEQELDINGINNIMPEGFCLLAAEEDEDGEKHFYVVEPDGAGGNGLSYSLLAGRGSVVVNSPAGGSCVLFLAACATSEGANGMIRKNNRFSSEWLPDAMQINNISPGYGGESEKTALQLRMDFIEDLQTPATAVTVEDYEEIVRNIPGLCIHQVNAIVNKGDNSVEVAVKPHSWEKYPLLSKIYQAEIASYLDERRMLTTRIDLVQPKYVPIDVQAVIFVKNYASNARAEIEQFLQEELDFVVQNRGFSQVLCYHEIFQKISELQCVDYVYEFSLSVQNRNNVTFNGLDIVMNSNCICMPGQMQLELNFKS